MDEKLEVQEEMVDFCKERKLKTVHVICRKHCKMTIRIKSFFGNVLGC